MASVRRDAVERAAALLVEARRGRRTVPEIPAAFRPASLEEAYAVQDAVSRALGPVGGWKVGASSPAAEPRRAPLLASRLHEGPATLPAAEFRRIGIEAELALRVGRDLPARPAPYTREEALAAFDTLHPAIEIVDSRFADREATDDLSLIADNQSNGAFVYGPAVPDWRGRDLGAQPVRLLIDGAVAVERVGGNTAGDPLRGVVWLANHLAERGQPLRAGQLVTTGSTTGLLWVSPGAAIEAEFPGLGAVRVAIGR